MATSAENLGPPRSLNSDNPTYVTFTNRCDRNASLYWYNFKGKFVRYTVLAKGQSIMMDTYVTHPWGARDAETDDMLLVDKHTVYYPSLNVDYDSRPTVYIDIPVYTLKNRCEQMAKKICTHLKPSELELPHNLVSDLEAKDRVQFVTYQQHMHNQHHHMNNNAGNQDDEENSDDDASSDDD